MGSYQIELDDKSLYQIEKCASYIKAIYAPICFDAEALVVNWTKEANFVMFTISGSQRDDGVLIGKSGATVQAIRLLVHVYAKANLSGIPCFVEIKDHKQSNYNPLIARTRPLGRKV